jgi:hypothetical protein
LRHSLFPSKQKKFSLIKAKFQFPLHFWFSSCIMSSWLRPNKTCAFGVINNTNTCSIGGELPPVNDSDVLVRSENGAPKVVVVRGRKKYKLELTSIAPTQLVEAARRAAQTSNAAFHHSVMPQHMMDATTVARHCQADMPSEEMFNMIGVTKAPAVSISQFDEMVRAWYWGLMTCDHDLQERCRLTTAAYNCFGWVLTAKSAKLSGKSKTS